MKNSIGNNVVLTVFGESHGKMIGATLDGLPSGIKIDFDFINKEINKRKAKGKISTLRREEDEVNIISGIFNGYTTGMPISVIIENKNTLSKDYEQTKDILRPGHADYTAYKKYYGFQDYRGGGHFSGRITAAIVAVGAICKKALSDKNIHVASHIKRLNDLCDQDFGKDLIKDINYLNDSEFAVLNTDIKEKMIKKIEKARNDRDSIGGILETVILNLPAGLGDPMFDSVEGCLSKALFGIGAVKGVEFGDGFKFADLYGSTANDCFILDNGIIKTKTNHNGGINGGITNGMPVIMKTVIKPTPSLAQMQDSVDISLNKEVKLEITGRHDPAIIHRARAVVDSITAIVIMDLLVTRYGQDWSKLL